MTCLLAIVFACHSGFDSLKSLCYILVPPRLLELGQNCSGFIKSLTIGTVGSDTVRMWPRTPTLFPSYFETHFLKYATMTLKSQVYSVCHPLFATLLVSHMLGPLSGIT
jgi:hypothetical protein